LKNEREIKFGKILKDLIANSEFNGNRKILARDELGISASALSQYINGKAHPRFETLVAMTRAFNVSLDYLVFGMEKAPGTAIDYGPVARYMDKAIAKVTEKADQRAEFTARIARQLCLQIAATAERVKANGLPPGLLMDDETMALEEYSSATWIVSMNLQYDVISEEGQDAAAGRFLPVVANNLRAGRSYRFLLPTLPDQDWIGVVGEYRRLLKNCQVGDQLGHCVFKRTDQPLIVGCGLYKLDMVRLQRNEAVLAERLRPLTDEEGWIGYTIAPSAELQGDALMDPFHLGHARKTFTKIWDKAKII
jgi:transcriptional regulator with XRE-family HTH domain